MGIVKGALAQRLPFTIHRQKDIILMAEWNYITNQSR